MKQSEALSRAIGIIDELTERTIRAEALGASLVRRVEILESRPTPERGEKGDPGEQGPEGPQGRDGVSIRDGFRQEGGVLILSLSDGTTRDLGNIVGPKGDKGDKGDPGEPGPPGNDGNNGADGAPGEKGLDGRDGRDGGEGAPGKDGRDGFSLEDFDVEAGEDGRTVTLKFQQGEVRHCYELVFPVMIDRGVFKADREDPYLPGDTVTWGGSLWTAQRETRAKPDSADSGWRLSVKKGRDGKDAKAA